MARKDSKEKKGKEKKEKRGNKSVEQSQVVAKTPVTAADLAPKFIWEEKLRVILGIILALLFLVLFGSVVWYFLTQLDTTFVNG